MNHVLFCVRMVYKLLAEFFFRAQGRAYVACFFLVCPMLHMRVLLCTPFFWLPRLLRTFPRVFTISKSG